jgi:pre-mRNA-splicing factor CWC22
MVPGFWIVTVHTFCYHKVTYLLQQIFMDSYKTVHRLEIGKLRNVAKIFAHLLFTDAINWPVLSVIKLNEHDTTSSSRIFVKLLFQVHVFWTLNSAPQ